MSLLIIRKCVSVSASGRVRDWWASADNREAFEELWSFMGAEKGGKDGKRKWSKRGIFSMRGAWPRWWDRTHGERNVDGLERQLEKTGGNCRNVDSCCAWGDLHRTLYEEVRAWTGSCGQCIGLQLTYKRWEGVESVGPSSRKRPWKMARQSNVN